MGTADTGQTIEIRESVRVPPGESQLVRLGIGELGSGNYRYLTCNMAQSYSCKRSIGFLNHGEGPY